MSLRVKFLLASALLIITGLLSWSVNHYRNKYQVEKSRADAAEKSLSLANATITDMQTRLRDVAALDARYTKELADAQKTISDLRGDVESGRRQLRVKATCNSVRQPSGTPGMDDAASPRLTDSAQRDYFTLRERISVITKQVSGLQEFITTQCLK